VFLLCDFMPQVAAVQELSAVRLKLEPEGNKHEKLSKFVTQLSKIMSRHRHNLEADEEHTGDVAGAAATGSKRESSGILSYFNPTTVQGFIHCFVVFVPIALVPWIAKTFLGNSTIYGSTTNYLSFVFAILAIMPLAGMLGDATEEISEHASPGVGGVLNATLGNVTELVIALVALFQNDIHPDSSGQNLDTLVKASMSGSILGNSLLVLGTAAIAGHMALKRPIKFDTQISGTVSTLAIVAMCALMIPALIHEFGMAPSLAAEGYITIAVAIILIVSYVLKLAGQFVSLRGKKDATKTETDKRSAWGKASPFITLIVCTLLIGLVSEVLVDSINVFGSSLSQLFMGVVVIAIVGNVAEHVSAIMAARNDNMADAVETSVGSSVQIAMFVMPVVVLASFFRKSGNMDINFSPLEICGMFMAMLMVWMILSDGEVHWIEGQMLISFWIILAIAFFFVKDTSTTTLTASPTSTNSTRLAIAASTSA